MPVSYPIPRKDGRALGRLDAPEGPRDYAMFSLAYGDPLGLKDPEQLYIMGESIAHIHVHSNDFTTAHERKPIDLAYLLDRPLERIRRTWMDDRIENLDLVTAAADEAREELEKLLNKLPADAWGPIGGDFHQNSVFFNQTNQPTFFNFDLCGPGWRAYDIAAFLSNTNLMHAPAERAEAFFAGYFSVRPLAEEESINLFGLSGTLPQDLFDLDLWWLSLQGQLSGTIPQKI